jgi:hypothetical protein
MQRKLKLSSGLFYQVVIIGFIFSACSSSKIVSSSKLKLKRDFCTPAIEYNYDTSAFPSVNTDSLLRKDTLLGRFITEQDILIANATGTLSLIRNMLVSSGDSSIQGQITYLENSEQIQRCLLLIRTEIDAISAELDCEAGRIKQISSYLGEINKKRNTKLTVGAILAGSMSTIAPVFVTSKTPQNAILISSGIISAGLGILTLNAVGKKVRLMHYRNLLEDIWFGPKKSTTYPPDIWYILNEPKLSSARHVSKARVVKTRWLKFELNNSIDSSMENLLFRDGGIYNEDNLDLRVTMLNEVQSAIRSINENLQSFVFNLNNISSKARLSLKN